MKAAITLALGLSLVGFAAAQAASTKASVTMIDANGTGAAIGTLQLADTKNGLLITPELSGLPAGPHGFHVHDKGSCGPGEQNGTKAAGLAAGGHFDPAHHGKHKGPEAMDGHKGDLPVLVVDGSGKANLPVLAPHLKVRDVKGHAIIIHGGGDNYADDPAPLGGGGARIACALVK